MANWAIPQQAKLKYTQLFNLHDRSRSGFLSGLQCRDILLQSGLPRNILAEIWNLSDIDGDGQLTREEFILAMHLTNQVRSGQTLPTELPADLIPPSYRRTRSISATSVHSATSASSTVSGGNNNDEQASQKSSEAASSNASAFASGSILNSNSFEDKRRENFEKGRAELERRRQQVIEQQSGILKEQLETCKKQVAEAKGKIDAMRSERDTKMGLITSLEAQLKTCRERQAYLEHEEQNIIAIAKDLNLVNSAQAELDQIATQAKLQSINHMKERLRESEKENGEKLKELEDVTKRIDESKAELKNLMELVSKTYEAYKEKVAKGKVLRQQFIEESKSVETVDLDSAWGSAPVFNDQSTTLKDKTIDDPWASSTGPDDQPASFANTAINNEDFTAFPTSFVSDSPFGGSIFEPTSEVAQSVGQRQPEMKVKKYRALYMFERRNPDELTINPGDIIVGSDVICEPGWLSGELNGLVGLFPEAYVEPLPDEIADIISNSNITTANDVIKNNNNNVDATTSGQDQTGEVNTAFPSSNDSDGISQKTGFTYKVIYAFDARNSDELTINPGDIITGVEGVHEPGWLVGELNGQRGLFPEAYVEKIAEKAPEPQPEGGKLQRMSSMGSLRSKKSRSKRAEVATVIANYRALGQEQLSLEKGQLVLIRRKMDSGWWEGEIQIKGKKKQFGWFPSSYVKLLS